MQHEEHTYIIQCKKQIVMWNFAFCPQYPITNDTKTMIFTNALTDIENKTMYERLYPVNCSFLNYRKTTIICFYDMNDNIKINTKIFNKFHNKTEFLEIIIMIHDQYVFTEKILGILVYKYCLTKRIKYTNIKFTRMYKNKLVGSYSHNKAYDTLSLLSKNKNHPSDIGDHLHNVKQMIGQWNISFSL